MFALIHQQALEEAGAGWPRLGAPLWGVVIALLALLMPLLIWRFYRRFGRPGAEA
ncbi:MAG: hypothetical protein QM750_27410 [Rubrivivax sp.]